MNHNPKVFKMPLTELKVDHYMILRLKNAVHFNLYSVSMVQRGLNGDKLSDLTRLLIFRSPLTEMLGSSPFQNISEHWPLIENSLHPDILVPCSLSSCLLDANQAIPSGSEYNEAWLVIRR